MVREINRPECNDLSTVLAFIVEQPFITIDPIGNHTLGDVFLINGTTNLAVGDTIHYAVTCESFNYTDPHQDPAHGYYGICKNTSVFEGGDSNRYSFKVNTTAWKPDWYGVFVESVDPDYTQSASFHLLNRSLYVSLSSETISPGESIVISGNATGGAENVSVWILGKDCLKMGEAVPVGADKTFAYSLNADETKNLSGKYSVVVQHPMGDGVFNVRPTTVCDNPFWIITATGEECNLSGLSAGDAVATLTGAMDSVYSDDRYQVLPFEVKAAEKSPGNPGGNGGSRGGGGGGGAAPRPPAQPVPQVIEKIGSAYLEADVNGTVETRTVVLTAEKRGSLSLDTGVMALDLFGRPLEKVSAAQVSAASLPEPDDASLRQVGPGLTCGPDRATFDPAVEICFTLTEDEWKSLGAGEEWVVRWYNAKIGAWEPLRTKVDPGTRQVIARTSHFSTFAVFAEPATVAPSETVAVTKTASAGAQEMPSDGDVSIEVPTTSAGPAPWLNLVGAGAALVVAGVICALWKRR
ncbi:hypothetical protein J2129_002122 [Methanofollis sp. W23]|uniref:hypothetical protein n=1 Tax=Methanofollis sp. W23 TaxID=2817849 RepID=UPI001AE11601|nr:hypothetical protein [Methanofollis sp. W23]MBP2146668.1 hypothetical protein [Methanofollis sp. W23]